MDRQRQESEYGKKPKPRTTREMTTALYFLRCKQMHLTIEEMDMVECGLVFDMMTESGNDGEEYPIQAGQKEFREFLRG